MKAFLLAVCFVLLSSPALAQLTAEITNMPHTTYLRGTCSQQLSQSLGNYNALVFKDTKYVHYANEINALLYDYDRNCGGSNRSQACAIKWTVIQEKYHERL